MGPIGVHELFSTFELWLDFRKFHRVDFTNRFRKVSEILGAPKKVIVNVILLELRDCPWKHVVLGDVIETSLRVLV